MEQYFKWLQLKVGMGLKSTDACIFYLAFPKPTCEMTFDFMLCQNGEIMAVNVDYFAFFLMGSLGWEQCAVLTVMAFTF